MTSIAFSYRPSVCPGRTVAVPDARYDSFVAAAELALILQSLQLPAVHIFAPEQHSALITLCLATAFPDHVASATVVGVPPLNNPDDQTYWEEEVVAAHLNPFEPDAWSELITGYVNYQYELDQGHAPCDVVDKLVDADARACTHRPEAVISWWATTLEVRGLRSGFSGPNRFQAQSKMLPARFHRSQSIQTCALRCALRSECHRRCGRPSDAMPRANPRRAIQGRKHLRSALCSAPLPLLRQETTSDGSRHSR